MAYTKLASDPPWLKAAFNEIGVKEISGSGSNDRIEEYLATTTLPKVYVDDATAWCAGFGNWCLITGTVDSATPLAGTKSAMAKSFKLYGQAVKYMRGAIAVFDRPPNPDSGHVGFVVGWGPGWVDVLGGNQSDAVTIERFSTSKLIALRWPNSFPLPASQETETVSEEEVVASIPRPKPAPRPQMPSPEPQAGAVAGVVAFVVVVLILLLTGKGKDIIEKIF